MRKINKTMLESLPGVKDKINGGEDEKWNPAIANFRKSHAVGFDLQRDSLFQEKGPSSTPTS